MFSVFSTIWLLAMPNLIEAQSNDSLIKEEVVKNMLVYHIRYCADSEIGLSKGGFLAEKNKFFYDRIINNSYCLNITINNDSSILKYPLEGYFLFNVLKPSFRFEKDTISQFIKLGSFSFDEKYLIAYNPSTKDIKFISGNFFLSRISEDFNLGTTFSQTWNDYLRMRLYKYSIEKFEYLFQNDNFIILKGYSQKRKFDIKIDKKDLDLIIVKYIK